MRRCPAQESDTSQGRPTFRRCTKGVHDAHTPCTFGAWTTIDSLALDRQIDAQQPQDTVQAITARIAADADEYARAWTYNGRTVRASVRAAYLAGYLAAVQTVAANLTRQDDEKGAR